MFISKDGPNTMSEETMKYFARISVDAFMDDPLYRYSAKKPNKRAKLLYHLNLARLYASYHGGELICTDEENKGICIFRPAGATYANGHFRNAPDVKGLLFCISALSKSLGVNNKLKPEYFPENTYTISPVYVDKKHWGEGVGRKIIMEGVTKLTEQGFKVGLESQNEKNIPFYEKLGFKTFKKERFEEGIDCWWMIYEGDIHAK